MDQFENLLEAAISPSVSKLVQIQGEGLRGSGTRVDIMRALTHFPEVSGYVRNSPRKSVEMLLQGSEKDIKEIIDLVPKIFGKYRKITSMEVSDVKYDSDFETGFHIVYRPRGSKKFAPYPLSIEANKPDILKQTRAKPLYTLRNDDMIYTEYYRDREVSYKYVDGVKTPVKDSY